MAHRIGVEHAVGRRGGLLHAHRRRMQELVHDLRGERLDRATLARAERAQSALGTLELRCPDRLCACTKGGNCGHDVERELPRAEALGLVTKVVPAANLASEAEALSRNLLTRRATALQGIKEFLKHASRMDPASATVYSSALNATLTASAPPPPSEPHR